MVQNNSFVNKQFGIFSQNVSMLNEVFSYLKINFKALLKYFLKVTNLKIFRHHDNNLDTPSENLLIKEDNARCLYLALVSRSFICRSGLTRSV